jgi:hypothetical protein
MKPDDRVHHVIAVRVFELVEAGPAARWRLRLSAAPSACPLSRGARRRARHTGRTDTGRTPRDTGRTARWLLARPASSPATAAGLRQRWIASHLAAAIRVERCPARVEQPVTGVQLFRDDLFSLEDPVAVLIEQHPRRAALAGTALRHDRPSERVERDDDQGLVLVLRRDPLDLETGQQRKGRTGGERLILRTLRRSGGRLLLERVRQPGAERHRREADPEILECAHRSVISA